MNITVVFVCEDVSTDTVKEVAVMADNHNNARKTVDCLFQGACCCDIKVVCRFVQEQHVAGLFEHHTHVKAVLFTTGKYADFFVLFCAVKVEP